MSFIFDDTQKKNEIYVSRFLLTKFEPNVEITVFDIAEHRLNIDLEAWL